MQHCSPEHLSREMEAYGHTKTWTRVFVEASILNSPELEAMDMSFDEWTVNKLVRSYSGRDTAVKRKRPLKQAMTWMNLQRTMLRKKSVVKDYMWQHSIYAIFFFKNQSIVDLQYCVSFRCTAKRLSYIHIFLRLYSIICYHRTLTISPCVGVRACMLRHFSCVRLCDPRDCSLWGSSVWSGLPCRPLGDLPNLGIKPVSPALAGGFFTAEPPAKPIIPCVIE